MSVFSALSRTAFLSDLWFVSGTFCSSRFPNSSLQTNLTPDRKQSSVSISFQVLAADSQFGLGLDFNWADLWTWFQFKLAEICWKVTFHPSLWLFFSLFSPLFLSIYLDQRPCPCIPTAQCCHRHVKSFQRTSFYLPVSEQLLGRLSFLYLYLLRMLPTTHPFPSTSQLYTVMLLNCNTN